MTKKTRTILPYREIPNGSLFRALKETGFALPRKGVFCKMGDSHAVQGDHDAIFAPSDMGQVVRFPRPTDAVRYG